MTPTPNNETPEIFNRLKATELSASEHADIKAVLLARAKSGASTRSTPSPYLHWIRQGSVAFASFALVFVGTAGAAQYSAPGDLLYDVKVNVTEELVSITTFDPEAKIAYDVLLLERRYDEMRTLAAAPESDSAAIATVVDEVIERTEDVTAAIAAAEEGTLTYSERINTLITVASLNEAHQTVTERVAPEHAESLKDNEEAIYASIGDTAEVAAAASSTATVLTTHISETLSEIESAVQATSTDEAVEAEVVTHLTELEVALTKGDLEEAVVSLGEAKQALLVEDYLNTEVAEGTEETLDAAGE